MITVCLDLAVASVYAITPSDEVYHRRKEREAAALRLCADLVALLFLDKSAVAADPYNRGRVETTASLK
jgi:hypothetical protein